MSNTDFTALSRFLTVQSALVCDAFFIVAVFTVLRRPPRKTLGWQLVKTSALVAMAAMLWALLTVRVLTPGVAATSIGLNLVSLLLFLWACRQATGRLHPAMSGGESEQLIEAGPYRYIRHPLYVSYVMSYLAAVVAAPGLVTGTVLAGMTAIYVYCAKGEEASLLNSPLATDYARYRHRTGFMWPRLIVEASGSGGPTPRR